VLVEIHDFSSRSVVASVYTNPNGGFNFDTVPNGNYELIATHGTDSVREDVRVRGSLEVVNLRLNTRDPNAPPSQNGMVSLAELEVPQRARDSYAKAQQSAVKGRPEEVLKHLEKALAIYPEYAPALTMRAAFSLDKGNITLAIDDLDKAIHADSRYALAHALMAAALNRTNKFDQALKAADRASSLSPNSWHPYFEMAKSYFGKADYQRALQQLTHAQSELPQEYAPLHLLRGQVFLRLNNYAEATKELTTFLKIAPNSPKAATVRDVLAQINAFVAPGPEFSKQQQPRP